MLIRPLRPRSIAGWALLCALLAGALTPHSHPLLPGIDGDAQAAGISQRVITDDASSALRWHSILKIERDDCVACHSQRAGDLARGLVLNGASERPEPLGRPASLACLTRFRLANLSRGPPGLL